MVHHVELCYTISAPNYKEIIEANLWNKVDIATTFLRKYDCFVIQWNQSFSGASESPWRGISGAAPGSRLIHSCWHFTHYHGFMWLPTHSEANGNNQEKGSWSEAQIWHVAQERRGCLNSCHHPSPGAWNVTAKLVTRYPKNKYDRDYDTEMLQFLHNQNFLVWTPLTGNWQTCENSIYLKWNEH